MSSTLRPYSTSAAPRLMVDVVLPTPPFWLHIAMIRAGPCCVRGLGSGSRRMRARAGSSRGAAAPISGSGSVGSAKAWPAASPRIAIAVVSSTSCPFRLLPGAVSRSAARDAPTVRRSTRTTEEARRMSCRLGDPCQHIRHIRPKPLAEDAENLPGRLSGERPRVAAGVHLAQPVDGDECVDLGGGHRGVAEQLLDDADVGAAVEQVGGEG